MADNPVLLLKLINEYEFLISMEVPEGGFRTGPFTINRQDLVAEVVFPSNPDFGWKRILLNRSVKSGR